MTEVAFIVALASIIAFLEDAEKWLWVLKADFLGA
jgi:hypothetical protein